MIVKFGSEREFRKGRLLIGYKKGRENSPKNSPKSQFSGFLTLKIILIVSFIILMQSRFLYMDIALELGPAFILIMRLFL